MAVKRRAPRGSIQEKPRVEKKGRQDPRAKPGKVAPRRIEPRTPRIRDPIPCPWTQDELAGIIERACRFIERAKETHGRQLGLVVGRHLYVEVYRRDIAYIRSTDPDKDDSLRDISRGCGVPHRTLHEWLMAGYVQILLEEAGVETRLGIKHLKEIATLGDDVAVMVAIARWATQMRITSREMPGIVDRWSDHLQQGGRLEDLERFPRPKPRPRPIKRRARTEELVVPRILELVTAWTRKVQLSPAYRARVRQMALGIRARLTGEAP